jgi:hypothetical protein
MNINRRNLAALAAGIPFPLVVVVAGILGEAGTLRAGVSKGPPASTEVAVLDAQRQNAGRRR